MAEHGSGEVSRRDFLRTGSMGVFGAGALPAAARAGQAPGQPEVRNKQAGMKYTVYGKTNFLVSRLGFGCHSLMPGSRGVVEAAIERGINLVHVAPNYTGGRAIKTLGQVLEKKRDKVFLILKAEPYIPLVERCLRDLRTGHVDLLMPPVTNAAGVGNPPRKHRFEDLRRKGKVRFVGLTCHSRMAETVQAATRLDYVSVLMPRYDPAIRDQLDPLLRRARGKGIACQAMKVFLGVRDKDLWDASLKDLYRRGTMDVALITFRSHQELDAHLRVVGQLPDRAEAAALDDYLAAHRRETCVGCAACEDACAQHVAIADILRFARYYLDECGEAHGARRLYRALPRERTAAACRDCGACERACPNGLPVRTFLQEAHRALA